MHVAFIGETKIDSAYSNEQLNIEGLQSKEMTGKK
jgi:hypothetical protein